MEKWISYKAGKKGLKSILGELEEKIMEILWDLGKARVSDIARELERRYNKKIAQTAITITCNRLYRKGLLERTVGRGAGGLFYIYKPKMTKKEFEKKVVETVLEGLVKSFGDVAEEILLNDKEIERILKEAKERK